MTRDQKIFLAASPFILAASLVTAAAKRLQEIPAEFKRTWKTLGAERRKN